jgi:photosystem II stability/assembly factor-like uncharacterized protein
MFSRINLLFLLSTCCGLTLIAQSSVSKSSSFDEEAYYKPVKWRNIGPFRGGRSVTATGVSNDPLTYYMGTTGGGLWKTADAGHIWFNISDGFFKTGSVGAVAVSSSDPNIVYCGMGEHAPRGVMTSYGDGVYKSTDAGKTWVKMGLDKTRQIARIIIHPKNPDIVYVAAQGALNGPTPERGIYKSIDGGKTWNNKLFVDQGTGCNDLSMDPNNPLILYASMWEHNRTPWKINSGGPGSGLYKSTDGGESWYKIHTGLPEEKGKMGISVSGANSDVVYALIESDSEMEKGGLFVSKNAGESWSKVSSDHRLVQRAWYYIEVFADPNDEHTVYVLGPPALRSIDGGKTWEILNTSHGDHHDLWINPSNAKNMVIADDGGASITFDRGENWTEQQNMPTAQMYRINVDNQFPYRIYGGQQDNTSVSIASRSLGGYGISEKDWTSSAGGESAFLAFDPDNPRFVMGGSYLGTIEILDTKANASTNIMPSPIQYLALEPKYMKYRYNWNAPIIWSKHEPNTFYHGAQVLLKTTDMGLSWEEVSPDLTRNEKDKQGKGGGPYTNEIVGAENYGTLSYVLESPKEKGVIWTGSDDGLVHLTIDGGKTWQNVTPKGLPECLINAIEVSPHNNATAYIAATRYKFNDLKPYLYKTTDYGKTWVKISNGIPEGAYTRVVREDDKLAGLLFAGTETGIFISRDGGSQWKPFKLNFPVVPVTDLMIKHGDLIAATSGRSFWILDDLEVIRNYGVDSSKIFLYPIEDTYQVNGGSKLNESGNNVSGTDLKVGVNPATGVVIYYQLPKDESFNTLEKVTLNIYNQNNELIRSFTSDKNENFKIYDGGPSPDPSLSATKGLNRFVWDMRTHSRPGVPNVYIEGSYRGHKIAPGKYIIELAFSGEKLSREVTILQNPLYQVSEETYKEYNTLLNQLSGTFTEMVKTVNQMDEYSQQLSNLLLVLMKKDKVGSAPFTACNEIVESIKKWDKNMVQRKSKAYDDVDNFENKMTGNYIFLVNQAESDIPAVTKAVLDEQKRLDSLWSAAYKEALKIKEVDLPALNKLLLENAIGFINLENRKD